MLPSFSFSLSLPLPILRKANGQLVFRVQNLGVPSLRIEKDQPVNQDNAALIALRFLDDVIGLPVHANLVPAGPK